MKNLFAFIPAICALLLTIQDAEAHNDFEFSGGVGYRLPSGLDLTIYDTNEADVGEGRLYFDGALVGTGTIGYRLRPEGFIYLSYTRALHQVSFERDDTSQGFDFTGTRSLEYFQFGGNVEATRGIFVPYMGFSVGLGRLSLGPNRDRFFFAPVLDPGLKIDLHKHVHLRLMGRVPLLFTKKDVVCVDLGCAHSEQVKPLVQLEALAGLGVSF